MFHEVDTPPALGSRNLIATELRLRWFLSGGNVLFEDVSEGEKYGDHNVGVVGSSSLKLFKSQTEYLLR